MILNGMPKSAGAGERKQFKYQEYKITMITFIEKNEKMMWIQFNNIGCVTYRLL